jgi:hypothetical protein
MMHLMLGALSGEVISHFKHATVYIGTTACLYLRYNLVVLEQSVEQIAKTDWKTFSKLREKHKQCCLYIAVTCVIQYKVYVFVSLPILFILFVWKNCSVCS